MVLREDVVHTSQREVVMVGYSLIRVERIRVLGIGWPYSMSLWEPDGRTKGETGVSSVMGNHYILSMVWSSISKRMG